MNTVSPTFLYEGGNHMKQQLFISGTQPRKDKFQKPSNKLMKPAGGMWTSSFTGLETGSDWVRWCLDQEYNHGADNDFPSWVMTPEDGVKVYTIDSFKDLQELHSGGFSFSPYEEMKHYTGLDFEALADSYDAIHLTERGQAETRFSLPNLYGWDCESVLWLKWKFIGIQPLGFRSYHVNWG